MEEKTRILALSKVGAKGGTRTPTVLLPPAPQAGASANSATFARRVSNITSVAALVREQELVAAAPALVPRAYRPGRASANPDRADP